MQSSPLISLSPSFNGYSSGKLAEIAARVVEELRAESKSELGDLFDNENEERPGDKVEEQSEVREEVKDGEEDEVDDFEFSFATKESDASPISADEIFYNGQIRPTYPIFNRDLLLGDAKIKRSNSSKPPAPPSIRLPLRKLFIEDRDPPSCSSSEADELDGIPPGTYCVWTPKTSAESTPGRCKKSNSTGSSKRWKFRDLLPRSNSDGKDSFVFLTPKRNQKVDKASKGTGAAKAKGITGGDGVTAVAAHYAKKDGDRRRSFLPYRKDLVGFFANVNGMSRNIHPF